MVKTSLFFLWLSLIPLLPTAQAAASRPYQTVEELEKLKTEDPAAYRTEISQYKLSLKENIEKLRTEGETTFHRFRTHFRKHRQRYWAGKQKQYKDTFQLYLKKQKNLKQKYHQLQKRYAVLVRKHDVLKKKELEELPLDEKLRNLTLSQCKLLLFFAVEGPGYASRHRFGSLAGQLNTLGLLQKAGRNSRQTIWEAIPEVCDVDRVLLLKKLVVKEEEKVAKGGD